MALIKFRSKTQGHIFIRTSRILLVKGVFYSLLLTSQNIARWLKSQA